MAGQGKLRRPAQETEMANVTFDRSVETTARETGLAGLIARMRADFAKWQEYRRTLNELSALPDRALADMGLHRSSIRSVAREAVYGR
jgi:uncharacterized protein YjiS (DUF1127 family)